MLSDSSAWTARYLWAADTETRRGFAVASLANRGTGMSSASWKCCRTNGTWSSNMKPFELGWTVAGRSSKDKADVKGRVRW